ncbi:MAG: peptidyl-tRNA hydrolase Pth2 [Candidatus Bathyarchaeia archaeon]
MRGKSPSPGHFQTKQCIIVRTDLGMSVGKLVAQACHACLEASEEARNARPEEWRIWNEEGAKKVILRVGSLRELLVLKDRVERKGLPNKLIKDRGLTEIRPGETTALGIGPADSEEIDEITGSLELLRDYGHANE